MKLDKFGNPRPRTDFYERYLAGAEQAGEEIGETNNRKVNNPYKALAFRQAWDRGYRRGRARYLNKGEG